MGGARIALAWELGGGLGHADRLAPWARELARGGARIDVLARDLPTAAARLPEGPHALLQAPGLRLGPLDMAAGAQSYAELLLAAGYGDADTLAALVRGWRSAFAALGTDLLVADHAPTALLAARVAGLPVVEIGDGFTIPPAGAAAFGGEARRDAARFAAAERRALASIRAIQREAGRAPLPALAALHEVALSLLLTCAALDHYPGAHRPQGYAGLFVPDQPSLASADAAQAGAPRQAAGVFAYLKPTHPQYRATVAALAQLKVPVRVYASGVAAPAGAAHLDWHLRPLPLAGALAGATLVVCHAGMAVVGASLHAGRPLVLLPGSYEQLLTARNVERLGAGLWVHPEAGADRVRKALKRALDDATLAQAAGAFARANARAPGATTAWLAETAGRIHAIAAGGRAG